MSPPPLSDTLSRTITVEKDPARGFVLGVYGEALSAAFVAFETAGSYGNGPAWLALAEYLASTTPSIKGLDWDDSSDAFFAFCKDRAVLEQLRSLLIETVGDEARLRQAIAAARKAGFGHGDL
jgi:hypothetical protein